MRLQDKLEEQGFTLVEIMVATAITSVIVLAGMAALTMTGKAVRANEQTSDAQQSARMAMEMITHDIKMAGFGPQIDLSKNPPPVGNCGIGVTPVPILPGDNNPVVEPLILDRIKSRSWCPSRFMVGQVFHLFRRHGKPTLHLVRASLQMWRSTQRSFPL